jgi:hypothetical protein
LLLLVFSQKSGAGLLLHNVLHTTQAANDASGKPADSKEISFSCNCIDDFLMPFAEPDEPVIAIAVSTHETPVVFFDEAIPFHKSVLTSLRGPPSSIL